MIEKMKKFVNINLIFILILSTIIIPDVTYAKTLGDLKRELQKNIDEYNSNQNDKKLTESQINSIKENINKASQEIETSQQDIKNLTEEIEQLDNKVKTVSAKILELQIIEKKKSDNFIEANDILQSWGRYDMQQKKIVAKSIIREIQVDGNDINILVF